MIKQLIFVTLLVYNVSCLGFNGYNTFFMNDGLVNELHHAPQLEDMFIRPLVMEANGDDGHGNRFYQKKVLINGLGLNRRPMMAAVDPLAKFFTDFEREYNEDRQREEQRQLEQTAHSLEQQNSLISSILGSMIEPRVNGDDQPLSLSPRQQSEAVVARAMLLNNNNNNNNQNVDVPSVQQEAADERDEKAVDAILRNIFGDHAPENNDASDENLEALKKHVAESEERFVEGIRHPELVKKNYFEFNGESGQISSGYSDSLSDKQMLVANSFADYTKNGQYDIIDSSYVFIELDKKVTTENGDDLLDYISLLTLVPRNSLTDLRVKDNLVLFKTSDPRVNSTSLVVEISKHQLEILRTKGLKIVSCGIGKDDHKLFIEKQRLLNIDSKSDKFVLATVISCLSVLVALIVIALMFLVRRRAQLRAKLAMDMSGASSSGGGKKTGRLDDEESLISGKAQNCTWLSFLPFICRSEGQRSAAAKAGDSTPSSSDYQELCRQRMQSKTSGGKKQSLVSAGASPLSSTICTNASETPGLVMPSIMTNSSAINSTPIRVTGGSGSDGKSDSSRSSTSS